MINKINNNQISDIIRGLGAKESSTAKSSQQSADATLDLSTESLLQKAQETTLESTNAVERARKMLLAGELDTPENIRKAAENIVDFGI